MHTLELHVESYFKKIRDFNSPKPIYILIDEFFNCQDKFLTNSSVHSINTRNKHHLHRPIANLSCFQKGTSYSRIRIFNNLPHSTALLRNEKPQFKVALNIFLYMHTLFTLWMNFLLVQMICITDLHTYDCKFSHCNNFICLVCFCMFF